MTGGPADTDSVAVEPIPDTSDESDTTAPDTLDQPSAEEPVEPNESHPETPSYRSLDWWKSEARKAQAQTEALTSERDQLAARVESMQQHNGESLLSDRLIDPADIWQFGPPVSEMLNASGDVDPERVDAAYAELLDAHKHLGRGYGISVAAPASAVSPTATNPWDDMPSQRRSFAEVLREAARGLSEPSMSFTADSRRDEEGNR
jgi:hypothetical protein